MKRYSPRLSQARSQYTYHSRVLHDHWSHWLICWHPAHHRLHRWIRLNSLSFIYNKSKHYWKTTSFCTARSVTQNNNGKALVNLLLIILWAQPGDAPGFQIDDNLLSGLFALAGTAIYSVLREYEIRQYISLEFSQKNVGNIFNSILHIISSVQCNDPTHYSLLQRHIVALSSVLRK